LVVIGILTKFGRQKNRDAIRKAWMGSGKYILCFVFLGATCLEYTFVYVLVSK